MNSDILWNPNELYHHGIKGQKWGVRRFQNRDGSYKPGAEGRYNSTYIPVSRHRTPDANRLHAKSGKRRIFHDIEDRIANDKFKSGKMKQQTSKTGDVVSFEDEKVSTFTKCLALLSKKARDNIVNTKIVDVKVNDKNVGDITLFRNGKEVNVVWLGINDEGKGYGQATMKAAIEYAKKSGATKMTLEVPGTSPNAKHIYEKMGFESTGEFLGDTNDVWGGLEKMELRFDELKHQNNHAVLQEELMNELWNPDELYHHGIKGQKWGVRRYQNYDGSLTSAGKLRYGSISLRKTKNKNEYSIYDYDTGRKALIRKEKLQEAEDVSREYVDDIFRRNYNVKLSEVERALERDGLYVDLKRGVIVDDSDIKDIMDIAMEATLKESLNYAHESKKTKENNNSSKLNVSSKSDSPLSKYGIRPPKNGETYSTREERKVFDLVYDNLEKEHPNFYKLPQDEQDELFWNFLNDSGLYQYL